MSTRGIGLETKIEHYVLDLETLVRHLQLGRFVLMAWGAFGHVAVRYATAHPGALDALILKDCTVSMNPWPSAHTAAIPGDNWEVFLRGIVMSGTPTTEYNVMLDICKQAVTKSDWQTRARAFAVSSVESLLPKLKVPTLVIQGRTEALLTTEDAMTFASMIPHSNMITIDGGFPGDATQGVPAIEDFIGLSVKVGQGASFVGARHAPAAGNLSARELEVLKLIAAGRSNPEISAELVISINTVQNHVRSILSKAGLANRTDAAAYATRSGLA
jgi:DNA-binding CsgD family transcriptional regulator